MKISQNLSFLFIFYLFYNANLIKIEKKHKCMLTINFINNIMYITKSRNATINNKILTKTYKKTIK